MRVVVAALTCLALAGLPHARAAEYDQRVSNLSSRAVVRSGTATMIAGFVISPGGPKRVLIRAVGPGLQTFGVPGVLGDPRLELYDRTNTKIFENDNWNTSNGGPTATAADFSSVGAFSLSNGSRDAALLATLAPGAYTAQVSGINSAQQGIALVEVYDVSGAARLMNISTRAMVESGAQIVISGVVVASGGGARRVLIRAAGPSLAPFGIDNFLADPAVAVLNDKGTQIASNDNWSDAGAGPTVTQAATAAGAFPFSATTGRDSALVMELLPGSYTLQVSGVAGANGVALVEVYDLTPEGLALVSVLATQPTTDSSGGAPGEFTFSRTGSTAQPLTLRFALEGTAVMGTDYTVVPTSVTIPAGAASTTLQIRPIARIASEAATKTVTLRVGNDPGYGVGASASAVVTLFQQPGTLYLANLRAAAAASGSTGYGTASLQLSADERFAFVNLMFSNLTSPQTVAYLRLGTPGDAGAPFLLRLPTGQVSGLRWEIRDTGTLSAAEILAAIKAGRVFVSVESANFPGGELVGSLVRSTASGNFSPPPAPPAVDLTAVSPTEAARFLLQATFGPTKAEIDALVQTGYSTWITQQLARPATLHRPLTLADFAANNAGGQGGTSTTPNTRPGQPHRLNAWWRASLTGEDQLRQRVAFALSQIFVISDQNGTINNWQEGAAHYYDVLVRGAFGNFRQLLEDVTLSPMMGIYLSHLRNAKAAGAALPDENYAREIMQLFTIGLNELNPDGTLRLDGQGLPIPTYSQTTISETARILTGWGFAQNYSANPSFRGGGGTRPDNSAPDYIDPMRLYPASHDDGEKRIVGGKIVPANQGGARDLADLLDTLFNHPNTGPFVSRQLIQRLVTSNPSPGYVYRVAQVFANNGAGVRGDLGAVVRAILLDYEARSPQAASGLTYGKLKEPLLRTTALFRAGKASTNTGRLPITNSMAQISQMALNAPTVFNFFEPQYVQPGDLAAAGLFAPEFQILTDTTAISIPNYLYGFLYNNRPADAASNTVYLDLTEYAALAATPVALVDRLNLILCGGSLSTPARDRMVAALTGMPNGTTDLEKARSAFYLMLTTPEGAVQR